MLEQTFGMDEMEISQLFAQVDKDCNGKITFGMFAGLNCCPCFFFFSFHKN